VAPAGPNFDVVARQIDHRTDRTATYYAVVDPIDPRTDAFKLTVKRVLNALVATNGGPKFSATIWDNRSAADTEVTFHNNPELFTDEMVRARQALNGQHLVANYAGGLPTVDETTSYTVLWFPEADVQNPIVGQWISAEPWNPSEAVIAPEAPPVPEVAPPASVPEGPPAAPEGAVPEAPAPEGVPEGAPPVAVPPVSDTEIASPMNGSEGAVPVDGSVDGSQ
jgi:hypothetical protein